MARPAQVTSSLAAPGLQGTSTVRGWWALISPPHSPTTVQMVGKVVSWPLSWGIHTPLPEAIPSSTQAPSSGFPFLGISFCKTSRRSQKWDFQNDDIRCAHLLLKVPKTGPARTVLRCLRGSAQGWRRGSSPRPMAIWSSGEDSGTETLTASLP